MNLNCKVLYHIENYANKRHTDLDYLHINIITLLPVADFNTLFIFCLLFQCEGIPNKRRYFLPMAGRYLEQIDRAVGVDLSDIFS